MDALASEYGWALDYIMDGLPLCQAWMFYRAILRRYGEDDSMPSFEQEDVMQGGGLQGEIRSALQAFKAMQRSKRQANPK